MERKQIEKEREKKKRERKEKRKGIESMDDLIDNPRHVCIKQHG